MSSHSAVSRRHASVAFARTGPRHLLALLLCAAATISASAQLNITRQPDSLLSVPAGQTATFTIGVSATPAPTFQWRRNGHVISGATAATYQIPAASQFDNDFYDVLMTSGGTTAVSQSSRLVVTPPRYPGAITVDLSRSLRLEGPENTAAIGPTFSQAALPDGRFYLTGPFSTINGQPARDLVRFHANGTVDSSFAPPAFNARPTSIALQPDGKLLVAGTFTTFGGTPVSSFIRLNPDGSRDTSFNPGIAFATSLAGAIHVTADGSIYLSGGAIGNPGQFYGYIARLSPSGALDTTFASPSFGLGSGGINPGGFVFGPSGEIYVYGGFDSVNGVARNRLARLLPNGQLDTTFNPGTGPNNHIYAIIVLRDGRLAIGGDFTAYNGTPVGRIARINTNGTLDPTFATGAGFSGQINFLAEFPGNTLLAGGPLGSTFNGTPAGAAVRLTSTGTIDPTFSYSLPSRPDAVSVLPGNRLLVTGSILLGFRPGIRILEPSGALSFAVTQPSFRFPATARVLAPLPGGRVLVAGNFTHVNGSPAPWVMRLNADLTRDASFPNGPGPQEQVLNALVQPDGKKIVLFTHDGFVRLHADGSTDTTFSSPSALGFWYHAPPVLLRDGRILVPTDSSFWPTGGPVTNGLVVLEPNGTRATAHPFLPGPNTGARITGVQRLAAGQLLITGSFTSWNGIARPGAVRLHADGSVDSSFVPDGSFQFSPFGTGIARNGWSIQRDGRLIAMSDTQPDDVIARINLNGTRDTSFRSGIQQHRSGGRFYIQPDDRILVVTRGAPTVFGNGELRFNRVAPVGGVDASFTVRGSDFWNEVMLADNGELLSSDNTGYLHRYMALPAPTIASSPVAQTAISGTNILLRVTATGEEPLAYQWFKDGTPLAGATSATLALDNIQATAAGSYTVAVTNPGGTVTSPAALVTVTARPIAGAVFGTFANNAGSFALYVRENDTGAFLAYLRESKTVLVARHVIVGSDRQFRVPALTSTPAGAGPAAEVAGTFAPDGSLSGTALGRSFSAAPATTSGSTAALSGFYEAAEVHTAVVNYTIIGANGSGYSVIAGNGRADAAPITFDATRSFRGRTENDAELVGLLEASFVRAVLQPTSGAAVVFNGADNDKRDSTEKLVNISTRSLVTAGGSFTAGFVVAGTAPKPVLIRAIGPTLASFQVERPLSAARLEVFRDTTSIASGNDWGAAPNATTIAATSARVGAFALPAASRDAALLLTLEPGAYSARVSGQGEATGVALVEVYDATEGTIPRAQRVVNISTLAVAGTGNDTLAAGFFVSGSVPKRLLIRGVGPALAPFGVSNLLARPVISVYSAGNTLRAQNAVWSSSPDATAIAAAAVQVGAFAFPSGSADAALLISLAPGSYTAQVSGVNNTTGTALVEIYEVP